VAKPPKLRTTSSELSDSRLFPNEPLWKRAPTRDGDGRPLTDFMMIIPKLRQHPEPSLRQRIARIQAVLTHYGEHVVFADLNLHLNVLWVSVTPSPGICLEIAAMIKGQVPEALLVGQNLPEPNESARGRFWSRFF